MTKSELDRWADVTTGRRASSAQQTNSRLGNLTALHTLRQSHQDSFQKLAAMVEETPETPTDRKAEFEKDWEQVRTGFGVLERKTAEALDIHAAKLTTAIQQMQQKGDGGFHAADGVAEFQLKLASSEERSRMLETTLSEMRSDYAMEKKILRDQYELHQEQYSNRALTAEADLHKLRAEFDIYQQRMQRIEQSHEQQKQRTSVAEQSLQKVRFGTHLCCSQASTRDEDVVALRDEAMVQMPDKVKDSFEVNQDVDGRSSDSGSTRCDPFSPLSSSYSTRSSGLWEYSTN